MQPTPQVPSSLDILSELIQRPTISADSNLGLIRYVAEFLSGYGIESHIVHNAEQTKANLYAVIGPRDMPGVILSGHTDVVPVAGQPWTGDPFQLRVIDGKAIGRGAVDMKGFIACALRSAALASAQSLRQPLILALSHDEEIGCVGVRSMLPRIAEFPCKPLMCIVGEPTDMGVVSAHKGKVMGEIRCTGIDGHSSNPDAGVNAIFLAADMIDAARRLQSTLKQPGHTDPAFTVPHSTVHIGVIQGGRSLNIIPRDCRLEFEIRTLPGIDQAALIQQLESEANTLIQRHRLNGQEASIEISVGNAYPALSMDSEHPGIYLAQMLSNRSGVGKVAFGTEAGLFQRDLGIPAVICGPGSVAQAHKPDEFVTLSQLNECDLFLERLREKLVQGIDF